MNNKIKTELENIEIPPELHERSKRGIQKAKQEMKTKTTHHWSKVAVIAASMVIVMGGYAAYQNFSDNYLQVSPSRSVIQVSEIVLSDNSNMKYMFSLIVHDGKVYVQSDTSMESSQAKQLLGRKLGTTKGVIDEFSKQDKYEVELASTTSGLNVFKVKGYDEDFRIMTYTENGGKVNARFYEHLNGITIKDGADVFGKLKLAGNIVSSEYKNMKDWNNNIDNYHIIDNERVINAFVKALNHATPFLRKDIEGELDATYKNGGLRELALSLKDGSRVRVIVMQNGYVHYGLGSEVYFKMDGQVFKKLWNELNQK
ncbi:hypothetical protein [Paenibacillus sp. LHD-38]|uniref:hypothetical protein n=1 Tax=Paenibacillus sp. LHD-38 TaxID=3072143 RepID=UPI00280F32AF|nr:hypothetical protein [Paenibacillus sp. LHD-38]MDQ8738238.1 hypothetical protein [Paenibacillus sp. LHD-38]